LFQKPGDIWKLAEAIHRELGPAEARTETVVFRTGPESVVRGAMKYVEENLAGIENSTNVSKHLGVAREHLSRQFARYTGQTLWDFITTCRILKAKELLREKDLLVKQISREVGFNCESSFFRAFIKKTGFTPETFRKTQRK
jgi:AraC-like DNA-binding protein